MNQTTIDGGSPRQDTFPNRISTPARRPGVGLSLAERRLLLAVVDLCLVNLALLGSLLMWGHVDAGPRELLLSNVKWFLTLSIVWFVMGGALDIYNPARAASTVYSVLNAGLAALLTGILYLAIPWLTPPPGRRLATYGFVALATGSIAVWRGLYARFFYQPAFHRPVFVVGGSPASYKLARELHAAATAERANPFRGTGYQVLGFVNGNGGLDLEPGSDLHVLEPDPDLAHRARRLGVEEIIVADDQPLSPELHEAILDCRELGLRVTRLSLAYERLTARLPVEYAVHDLQLIAGATDDPVERLYRVVKRLTDLLAGLVGVVLVLIVVPFVALLNRLFSPGPLFYRQQRVGRGGRPFVLIKFRTMRPDAESQNGAVWAAEGDPRITPLGHLLRRTRLDELPQFINVLRGEMSLVGPRPERPQFVGQLGHTLPLYRARHAVRPGITGWAQVRYRYGNTVDDATVKLEYDLYYLKHAGFLLDLLIMLKTLPVMIKFQGK